MKNARVLIETEKKKIPLVFNLNVMEEIQEKYGTLEKWGEVTAGGGEPKVKDLKAGIKTMINEAIDIENEENGTDEKPLSEKQVGRILSEVGLQEVIEKIQEITVASTPTGENEEKNA